MSNLLLKCDNLYKSFGKKKVIKGLSLELYEGDILGFIGPNGSGKTTTIKMILGLQKIDKGTVTINGADIEKDFVSAISDVGAIVENPDLYMYLSGRKNLELIARMYKNISPARIDEVVKLVKLEKRINDKVSKYSLGMRQRLGIAQALLHDPDILILDEPTNGLDPEGIKELRDILKDLAKKYNKGILISSHNLAELESFCNKVCIIQNGIVLETAEVKNFKKEVAKNIYFIEVDKPKKALKALKNSKVEEDNIIKVVLAKEEIPNIIKTLVKNDIAIYQIYEAEASLEEAFLTKVGGNTID
ncbi:MAG TPA: ABC transporter ATP-binding protein [Bacilli bacterium]|nr:ABC transporter ATP-binding protein [Bacilli bacterium]